LQVVWPAHFVNPPCIIALGVRTLVQIEALAVQIEALADAYRASDT